MPYRNGFGMCAEDVKLLIFSIDILGCESGESKWRTEARGEGKEMTFIIHDFLREGKARPRERAHAKDLLEQMQTGSPLPPWCTSSAKLSAASLIVRTLHSISPTSCQRLTSSDDQTCVFLKKKSEPTAFSSSAWVHFPRLNANVHNYNTGHVYGRLMLHSGFCQFCIKEHSYRTVISKLYFSLLLGRITNQRLRTRLLNQTVTLSQHSALFTYDFLPLSPLLGVHIS